MANILLIGDSWAITPVHLESATNWFEYQLMKRGHNVFTKCWGASQNLFQLHLAETFLEATKESHKIDMVIWFHTELMRCWNSGRPAWSFEHHTLDSLLDTIATETYQRATELKNKYPDIKWAIIGGHAAIRPSHTHLLNWADFKIDNWRSEIVGEPMPECHTTTFLWLLEQYVEVLGRDIVERELDSREKIMKACSDRTKFYDDIHPNIGPITDLAQRIISHFNL